MIVLTFLSIFVAFNFFSNNMCAFLFITYVEKNSDVMEFMMTTASIRAGVDMDSTLITLPTEEEDEKTANELNEINAKTFLISDNQSRFLKWRDFLDHNSYAIEDLPENSQGKHMLSGTTFLCPLHVNLSIKIYHGCLR